MGRTVPTFRNMIELFGLEWCDFKRALRSDDKNTFDDLLNHARKHGASGTNMVNPNPFEPIVISILILLFIIRGILIRVKSCPALTRSLLVI